MIPTPRSIRFGRTLRKLRRERGWTQEDLGAKARNLQQPHISKLEAGERWPDWITTKKLHRAFGDRDIVRLLKA